MGWCGLTYRYERPRYAPGHCAQCVRPPPLLGAASRYNPLLPLLPPASPDQACHAKGIQADMQLLNLSLQHHRQQPMSEAQAAHVAATVLGINGGDVMAAVQQLIGVSLLRIAETTGR